MEQYIIKNLNYYCNVKRAQCDYYPAQNINYYVLTFVLEGSSTYIIDGKKYSVNKKNAIFLSPGVTRERIDTKSPVWFVNFNFYIKDGFDLPLPVSLPVSEKFLMDLKKLLQLFPYSHIPPDRFSKQKLTNLLNFILLELLENDQLKSKNQYVNKIIKIIDERLTEKLTLQSISAELNLSKEYVSYIFKKETGKTLTNYINEQKMLVAREYIANSGMSLVEISQVLGFDNYNYFSRLFKKHYNRTPIEIKKTT